MLKWKPRNSYQIKHFTDMLKKSSVDIHCDWTADVDDNFEEC